MEGGAGVRKSMRFDRPGPLVLEHQTALAELLSSLQQTHFANKPVHMRDYNFDVLYPEVGPAADAVSHPYSKLSNLAFGSDLTRL